MDKQEIIKGLKEHGTDFIYTNWHKLTEDQKREIAISSVYILLNNNLLHNENTTKNTLIDELENTL